MKNKEHQLKGLTYKVLNNKDPRKFWSLDQEEREHFERLGCEVVPKLYKIQTKKIPRFATTKSKLLKELDYYYKRGKRYTVKELSNNQVELLRSVGIYPLPLKYQVTKTVS